MEIHQRPSSLHSPVLTGPVNRFAITAILASVILALVLCRSTIAQDTEKKNSSDSRLFAKLSAPMTSIVDGRSFREGVTRMGRSAGVNVWIDRHVDPSRVIESGRLGPTAYMAMKKLASDHGCVVMPIRSVVLVGKEDWVDRVVADLLKLPVKGSKDVVDVSWPRLTTPGQAFGSVNAKAPLAKVLPHDLWPEVTWKAIDPKVALTLVRMQLADRDESVPPSKTSFAKRRRLAADRQLSLAAAKVKSTNPLNVTFSLTTQTRAADVLKQLCAAANLRCVIEASAAKSCGKIVSISENDVTLRHLIETVAKEAGVVPRWETSEVVFGLATSPQ